MQKLKYWQMKEETLKKLRYDTQKLIRKLENDLIQREINIEIIDKELERLEEENGGNLI
ncbi:MAG: hypothetical protein ACOCV1_01495 [Bacillota bacterium]